MHIFARFFFFCLFILSSSLNGLVNSANLIQGNNQFAFDLYARIKESSENVFFSPYSVTSTLVMAYLGSQGETEMQMQKTLHYPGTPDEVAGAFGGLNRDLVANLSLKIANSLWIQASPEIIPEYEEIVKKNFESSLFLVDFNKQVDSIRYQINKWVAGHTAGRITGLLQPRDINSATKMVLVGAIYFQAPWKTPFGGNLTKPAYFRMSAKKMHPVPVMHQVGYFPINEMSNATLISLPYGNKKETGSALSFWALLPRELNGLTSIENDLSVEHMQNWLQNAKSRHVKLSLPKFHLTETFSLGNFLKDMGMPLPFSDDADFAGISRAKDLFINKVIHKAYISVNEKGTEATAATAVSINTKAAINPEAILELNFDHPFLFFIVDDSTGLILFMGRIASL